MSKQVHFPNLNQGGYLLGGTSEDKKKQKKTQIHVCGHANNFMDKLKFDEGQTSLKRYSHELKIWNWILTCATMSKAKQSKADLPAKKHRMKKKQEEH